MMPPAKPAGRWLALVGMMGAGKSTIGQRLALALDLPFVDLDARIEAKAQCSIPDLFARQGEAAFRQLERACLRDTLQGGPVGVLATGGGATADPANLSLLLEGAYTVYLELPLEALVRRLDSPSARAARPMLEPGQVALRSRLAALLAARRSGYEQAHLTVDGTQTPQDVTNAILSAFTALQP